jgi:Kef-type K+ transport system membrane component KefB
MWVAIADWLQIDLAPPEAPFWAALALVAGGVLGEAVRRGLGLPRIVGYGAVGLLAGALLGRGLDVMHGTPRLVVDLALALLLFELGSRVRLAWLRANPALLATGLLESLLAFGAVFAALRLAGLELPAALALATLGSCGCGAVVMRVSGELRAAGQVTERLLVITAMNTLFAVLLHRLLIGWLHLEVAGDWVRAVALPLWVFGGSVLVAALLALLVAHVARRLDLRDENAALLLLGLVVLALVAAKALALSTLLVPLLAGVVLRNTTARPWVWPRHFGTAGGVLVLMMFVAAGSAWSLQAVALGGALGALLLAVRVAAQGAAVLLLAPWSGLRRRQAAGLALALAPMSATALVLLADLQATLPGFAPQVAPIALSAVAFSVLLGPLAVQWGLRLAAEAHPDSTAPRTVGVAA